MEAKDSYRDALYESYVSGHQGQIREAGSGPAFESDIVSRIPDERDIAILDVGCGQGQVVRLLADRGYSNVRGIDVSREQIELAKQLGTQGVEQADLFAFAEENRARFSVVVAIDLVEHFDRADVPRLFATLGDLLAPEGLLILRTPNGASPYAGRILYGDLTHGTAYTTKSLDQVASQTGFDDVRCYPVRPAGNGTKQRVRRVLWRLIEGLLIVPLIVETGHLRGHVVTQNVVAVMRRRREAA